MIQRYKILLLYANKSKNKLNTKYKRILSYLLIYLNTLVA